MSYKHAKAYKKNGFSIIATDEGKRPIGKWKQYQTTIATDEELAKMFSQDKAYGVAVICGAVSGNLEVIDIDCKYDLTSTLFADFMQLVVEYDEELAKSLLISKTINGGYHVYYRCDKIEGNKKLANRETTKEEKEDNPNDKQRILIETRGDGGYVVAPDTNGYTFIQNKPDCCPKITIEHREVLMEISRSFNQLFETLKTPVTSDEKNYSITPFDDYNQRADIVGLLEKHGWKVVKSTSEKVVFKRPGNTDSKTSGDFNIKMGWFSVFTTSTQFEPNKAYRACAVYAILEANEDYKLAAKQLLSLGYGRQRARIDKRIEGHIRRMRDDGRSDQEITDYLKQHENLPISQAEELIKDFKANSGDEIKAFWEVSAKGKEGKLAVNIIYTKLERFLTEQGGYFLYFYDLKSNIFKVIRNDHGLIEEASTEQIKKFIKEYILTLPWSFDDISRDQLLELTYRNASSMFNNSFFEFLEPANIDFLRDTAETAYFPFKNGVVCVSKDGYELKTYGELKKSIWKSQVIDFNIDLQELDKADEVEYFSFIKKICNDDIDRIKYCSSIIGYLLHKFKDPAMPYCVILAEETEDEKKGGGTGKGILINGISRLINAEQVDGKNFKLDKNFAFQRVKLDTKLVAIQDVRKNVDFEGFYSIITEGITIEKKNKDELYIPYADSPKIMFTTNYSIPDNSNHARRRQKVLEFGGFFTPENTPLDFFGHRLFEDWDGVQWNRFYNFMFSCVMRYMREGICTMEMTDTSKRKKIRLAFGEEFYSWFEDNIEKLSTMNMFHTLYDDFITSNDFDKKTYTVKRFKKGLEDSSAILGLKFFSRKNRIEGNKVEVQIKTGEIDVANSPQSNILPLF